MGTDGHCALCLGVNVDRLIDGGDPVARLMMIMIMDFYCPLECPFSHDTAIRKMFCTFVIWKLFGNRLEVVWKSFGSCLEVVWKLFGSRLEVVWKLFGSCRTAFIQ